MNEDLMKIFTGMDLTEDTKTKISGIFEARVAEEKEAAKKEAEEEAEIKAEEKYEKLSESYAEYVISETEEKAEAYINEEVLPNVSKYVSYAAQEFMKENEIAIASGLKVQLAESFLTGMTNLAESFNVSLPENAEGPLGKLQDQLDEANKKIDSLINVNLELNEAVTNAKKQDVIETVTEGMTETRKEKFILEATKIKFLNESQYQEALDELKESFTPSKQEIDTPIKQINEKSDPWLDNLLKGV